MKIIAFVLAVVIWLYVLRVLSRAKLSAWRFLVGALGLFMILMIYLVPYITEPLARAVASIAGLFGALTGWFTPYFQYGIIFIHSGKDSLSMLIDFECSGVIEMLAFVCLLIFFDIYRREEKVIIGIAGSIAILLLNSIRIMLIASIVHFGGTTWFYMAHTFIGRIFFYVFTVALYYFVFTKPQIVRMKVGSITYGRFKSNS